MNTQTHSSGTVADPPSDRDDNQEAPRTILPEFYRIMLPLLKGMFSFRGLRLLALGGVGLAVFIVILFSLKQSKNEVRGENKTVTDPQWLTVPLPNLQSSYDQFSLFLENEDPTRGQMGLIADMQGREASRLRSLVFSYVNDSSSPCFRRDSSYCFSLMEQNLVNLWNANPSSASRLQVLMETKALFMAQYEPVPPPSPPNDAIFPLIFDKFRADRTASYSTSLNALAEAQLRSRQDFNNSSGPSNPGDTSSGGSKEHD